MWPCLHLGMQHTVCALDMIQIYNAMPVGGCSIWYSQHQTHRDRDPTDYFGLRLPWLRGRSCTRNVCLFLLYLVL